jgi:hypothetical protein
MSKVDHSMPNQKPEGARPTDADELIGPEELHKIAEKREMALLRKSLELDQIRQKEQENLRHAFMTQHMRPDAREYFTRMVRQAAEDGRNEIEIFRFPSEFCSDGGRRINNFEPDWAESLTGVAREIYEAFEKELRPKGYRMRAQIVDFPGGVPGNVGLFLRW